MRKKIIISLLLFCLFFLSYSAVEYNVKNNTNYYVYLKNKISYKTKKKIRKKIQHFIKFFDDDKLVFEKLKDIENKKVGNIKIFNNKLLNFKGPRAYMASNKKNFFLITGNGSLYYTDLSNFNKYKDLNAQKIETNIPKIFKNYKADKNNELERTSMVKSILVLNNIIYISATVKENSKCYKQKIFKGKLNLKKIHFNEFFQIKDCRLFYDDTSGGNIISYKNNKILYTLGDWKACQYLDKYPKNFCITNGPQNLKSSLGKIMTINLQTKRNKYISTGHNNPQGITFNKNKDIIFSAEHGPQGGDEINMNIRLDNSTEIKNFGWPISSYGEHYGFPSEDIKYLYNMAPLYKSHKKHGFVEPLDYFVPSIGISDIQSYKSKLFVASMGSTPEEGDLTLYIYDLDEENKIKKKDGVFINQRIRDLHLINNDLFLFLESTGSIAVINLDKLK
jgi:hypothetical protein